MVPGTANHYFHGIDPIVCPVSWLKREMDDRETMKVKCPKALVPVIWNGRLSSVFAFRDAPSNAAPTVSLRDSESHPFEFAYFDTSKDKRDFL